MLKYTQLLESIKSGSCNKTYLLGDGWALSSSDAFSSELASTFSSVAVLALLVVVEEVAGAARVSIRPAAPKRLWLFADD
jgi:hypothetical protein